jgi:hypothetical protein
MTNNQLPGDSFLLKLALVNTRTFLLQKGLDALSDILPESIIEKLTVSDTPPEHVLDSIEKEPLPTSTEEIEKKSSLHTRESQTDQDTIKTDEDLVQVMRDINDPNSERNKNKVKDESHKASNPFFEDDWKIPYGGSFTLLPPYIQI